MATDRSKAKNQKTPEEEKKTDGSKSKERDASGRFTKGHKKQGGRQLGTKNRAGNIRDRLKEYLEPFIDEIPLNLVKVQKEEGTAAMLGLMEKFMPYCMPKYSALSIGADQDRPMDEESALLELDAKYTQKELSINFKTMIVVNNDAATGDYDPDEDPNFDISQFDSVEK